MPEVGKRYATTRNGITSYVWVAKVKGDKVQLKRNMEAVDSFTEHLNRFSKYYELAE